MRTLLIIASLLALVLAATAFGASASFYTLRAGDTAPCTAPAKFSRVDRKPFSVSDADAYRLSCQVARVFGPRRFAREYGVRSTKHLLICEGYARTSYRSVFWAPAIAGCLKGFRLRHVAALSD